MSRPTVIDVAKRAAVSKSTVSLVLNGSDRVHPETARRVWQAIEELNYVPSRAARVLQSGRSRMLGVLVSDVTNPYFAELLRSVSQAAGEADFETFTFDTDYNPQLLLQHIDHLRQHRCDGVFVFTTERTTEAVSKLRQARLPSVLLNWGIQEPGIGDLAVDYGPGMLDLIRHLVDLGHQRFAFVHGPREYFSAAAKEQAFLRACRQVDPPIAEPLLIQGDTRLEQETGERVADALLAMDPSARPTAVIASNDLMALSVLRALHLRGVPVPESVSVAGIDDIDLSAYFTPALTSLRQPRRQMGRLAFEMMQALLAQQEPASVQRCVSVRLIVRESTGPSLNYQSNRRQQHVTEASHEST